MFLDETSDEKHSKPPTNHSGTFSTGVVVLLASLFLITTYGKAHFQWSVGRAVGLRTNEVLFDYEYWRFFSYMWFHDSLFLLVACLTGLYFLGPPVEREWGGTAFCSFLFFCSFVAGLASFLFAAPETGLLGVTGAVLGLCAANLMLCPDRTLLNLVPARYGIWAAGALVLLIHYYVGRSGGDPTAAFSQVAGALAGWIWIVMIPVVEGWWERWRAYRRRQRRKERARMRRNVEKLLEKISDEGMDSLTAREKETLRRASEIFDDVRDW